MKVNKNKIITFTIIAALLLISFWYGGGAPGLQGWNISNQPKESIYVENDESIVVNSENNLKESNSLEEKNSLNKNTDKTKIDKTKDEEENSTKENDTQDKDNNTEHKINENKFDEENIKIDEENIKIQEEINKIKETKPSGLDENLSAQEKVDLAKSLSTGGSSPGVLQGSTDYSKENGMEINESTGKDKYLTDPVPEGKPVPVEPQNVEISNVELTCTLSVRCDTILDNINWLDPEKVELVPSNGVIFETKTVTFYEGESVFNVLQREMKKSKIHMEFANTPMYNSVYIEGINNLYEFDCGELSGWMYKVNGWFPNYGASRYQIKEGDVVEWVYTCDLGVDVGGFYSTGS